MQKFTMGLVWHNCKHCPPKESYNPCLYITDGTGVLPVMYKDGQFIYEDSILYDGLENVWWADLNQTVTSFFAGDNR